MQIEQIKLNGGTQPRESINAETVAEYADAMKAGATFPPVTVFYDGADYWLADGFHRVAAIKVNGGAEVEAEVKQGTRRDAILHSVGANSDHGLRRTNSDKRRAVMALLNDDEWSGWSNMEIARRCAVSESFVRKLRDSHFAQNEVKPEPRTYTTKHGTTATMNTTNIGKQNTTTLVDSWEAPELDHEPTPPTTPLVDLAGIDPNLYTRATKVGGALTRLAEMTQFNPNETATGFKDHEKPRAVGNARVILDWLEQFVQAMEGV